VRREGFESSARNRTVVRFLRLTTLAPRGIRPRTNFGPVEPKFFSALEIRPVLLNGIPRISFRIPLGSYKRTNPKTCLGFGFLCAERDSNPRRPKPPRLQRGVIDHSTIDASIRCYSQTNCEHQSAQAYAATSTHYSMLNQGTLPRTSISAGICRYHRRKLMVSDVHDRIDVTAEHSDSSKKELFSQAETCIKNPASRETGRVGLLTVFLALLPTVPCTHECRCQEHDDEHSCANTDRNNLMRLHHKLPFVERALDDSV
jgi:hypothetical protein